jgi:RNA polymerase sigma-70 factor (ECF subfamily)
MDDGDGDLVERARQGDTAAYDALVHRHQGVALRVAYVVGGGADAEDAAQDAFVKAYRALDRFRPGAPFRPWLLRIVANEARNRGRSSRRRSALALRVAHPDATAVASPEDMAVAGDRRRRVLDAVNALPEKDRMVIGCRYFAELSEAETAAALGWPAGTVKSRTSRALDRLRTLLPEEVTP